MDITNRTVFIAGATSGIGLELARRFAAVGSAVIAGGRRTGLLGQLAAEGFATVPIDVTDQDSIDRARDTILRSHPGLDTIVTMSGIGIPEDLRDPAHFSEVMDLLQTDPAPHEILVKGVLMHRWAERDGTYDELVAQRSQALAMLPRRQ
jgi:uncharacterized oxidoreductase